MTTSNVLIACLFVGLLALLTGWGASGPPSFAGQRVAARRRAGGA